MKFLINILLIFGVIGQYNCTEVKFQTRKANTSVITTLNDDIDIWKPAVYKGLTIGKSKRKDLVKVLGQPKEISFADGNNKKSSESIVIYYYTVNDNFVGNLEVEIKNKSEIIESIIIYPENLNKSKIIELFGKEFKETSYGFDECLNEGGEAPLFETSNGQIHYIEYRNKGIAAMVDTNEKVIQIEYIHIPIGKTASNCN